MVVAGCPRCANPVALHQGHPQITAAGTVELWHHECWIVRDVPLPPVALDEPPVLRAITQVSSRGRGRSFAIAGGLAGALVLTLLGARLAGGEPAQASQVDGDTPVVEVTSLRSTGITHEEAPPKPRVVATLENDHQIPIDGKGKPIDETFTSLKEWVHPITAAGELIPGNPARHFGAHRGGIERAECGEGHCGIDLDGPLGRPLVAVAGGVLITVERREKGPDGLSGRFVRIQHDDGTLTSYMHMDEIDSALQPGDHVASGQYLGTLGMTAVEVAHLHFALEVPNTPGSRDTMFSSTHFVDPAPFLVRSTIVESAVRRHAVKPAL